MPRTCGDPVVRVVSCRVLCAVRVMSCRYGRGVTDDKGPIIAFVFAVKQLLANAAAVRPSPLPPPRARGDDSRSLDGGAVRRRAQRRGCR
jgi:hypothetical protein